MDQDRQARDMKQPRLSLSQETITILTVGAALAGIILVGLGEMRVEREAMRADARADRARIEASMNQMRAEGQASREAFEKEITRLVEQQGTLNGLMGRSSKSHCNARGMSRETILSGSFCGWRSWNGRTGNGT